jgi:G3E family GTPase
MTASRLSAIPTNIITGFLGTGKTTAILQLLKNKPAGERWAVLVNEFGEVGIDGRLLGKDAGEDIFVHEVPGGCMCCTNGLPVQIALNRLLRKARPQRLLIEPTGLGHPAEIIALLRSNLYREALDLRATLTLVDARHLHDDKYVSNATFQQQLQVADVVVGNKEDTYTTTDREQLDAYCSAFLPGKRLLYSRWGALDISLLDLANQQSVEYSTFEAASPFTVDLPDVLPDCGYLQKSRDADGYFSSGWIFSPDFIFDYTKVFALLNGCNEERLKAVLITDQGVFGFNKSAAVISEIELDDALDSRVEIIQNTAVDADAWLSRLLALVRADPQ